MDIIKSNENKPFQSEVNHGLNSNKIINSSNDLNQIKKESNYNKKVKTAVEILDETRANYVKSDNVKSMFISKIKLNHNNNDMRLNNFNLINSKSIEQQKLNIKQLDLNKPTNIFDLETSKLIYNYQIDTKKSTPLTSFRLQIANLNNCSFSKTLNNLDKFHTKFKKNLQQSAKFKTNSKTATYQETNQAKQINKNNLNLETQLKLLLCGNHHEEEALIFSTSSHSEEPSSTSSCSRTSSICSSPISSLSPSTKNIASKAKNLSNNNFLSTSISPINHKNSCLTEEKVTEFPSSKKEFVLMKNLAEKVTKLQTPCTQAHTKQVPIVQLPSNQTPIKVIPKVLLNSTQDNQQLNNKDDHKLDNCNHKYSYTNKRLIKSRTNDNDEFKKQLTGSNKSNSYNTIDYKKIYNENYNRNSNKPFQANVSRSKSDISHRAIKPCRLESNTERLLNTISLDLIRLDDTPLTFDLISTSPVYSNIYTNSNQIKHTYSLSKTDRTKTYFQNYASSSQTESNLSRFNSSTNTLNSPVTSSRKLNNLKSGHLHSGDENNSIINTSLNSDLQAATLVGNQDNLQTKLNNRLNEKCKTNANNPKNSLSSSNEVIVKEKSLNQIENHNHPPNLEKTQLDSSSNVNCMLSSKCPSNKFPKVKTANITTGLTTTRSLLREQDLKHGTDNGELSIIERNARVIKWLYHCRKINENQMSV